MEAERARGWIAPCLAWLGVLGGALVLMLTDLLPVPPSFVQPDTLFLCFLECQVFFVVLLWPLFVPALLDRTSAPPAILIHVAALLVFSLPLTLVCANVSDIGPGAFLAGQALVGAWAAFVVALFALGRGPWTGPAYYLFALSVSAAPPFLGFLCREFLGSGPDLEFLAILSPFWSAVGTGTASAQAAVTAVLAAVFFAVAILRRRKMDAAAPSG